jgi:hypothetical protein
MINTTYSLIQNSRMIWILHCCFWLTATRGNSQPRTNGVVVTWVVAIGVTFATFDPPGVRFPLCALFLACAATSGEDVA